MASCSRWTLGAILCLALLCPARPAAAQWRLDMTTGVRAEQGGDADLLDRGQTTRNALRWSPRLRWSQTEGPWSARVEARPDVELPPRRSGQALSGALLSMRLRHRTAATRWTLQAGASRSAFDPSGLWASRRRLSAGLGVERFLRRGLALRVDADIAGGWYEAAEPAGERRDDRLRLRAGLLAWRSAGWLTVDVETTSNASTWASRDYRSRSLSLAGGVDRGPRQLSAHLLHDDRQRPHGLTDWRLRWLRLHAERRLGRGWGLYAQAQRETGRAGGERLFDPWTLWEVGVRLDLPLGERPAPADAASVARPSLEPVAQGGRWVFRFPAKTARSVHLVGSFSDWDASAHPMERRADGWVTTVRLDPGVYQYAFVVDGTQWRRPPAAPRYADDGFGQQNGVLTVVEGAP